MQFDNLTHCEIEEQAKRLLESYFASRNMSLSLPIPIEAIAEHYLGYDIEISDEGVFASPLVLGGIIFDQKKVFGICIFTIVEYKQLNRCVLQLLHSLINNYFLFSPP